MSTWDDTADQRRGNTDPVVLDEQGQPIPSGSDGTGSCLGVVLIMMGIGTLVGTGLGAATVKAADGTLGAGLLLGGGLVVMGIVALCMEKSNDNTMQDMHQEAANKNVEGVTAAAAGGGVNIVVLGCIAMLIVLALVAAMKGMGL